MIVCVLDKDVCAFTTHIGPGAGERGVVFLTVYRGLVMFWVQ